ncbi:hydroxypyruvate isomerase [Alcaligenes endophyticus]|uniref:Hydroxypyruvate isomerase n=1 Tax=Alcaligenes endophyticus TaxID=1929088 RepID=A0ABT8EGQ7_9BURK|nr:hydroxypyruvate isomerase [Alcaligenes endophyticus]MCX5589884.1 hydroxypyruvate isomerase [Alcaligenes endophyticus]MDN4120453.1 hydroxypyruvate isomerase [Alcaligenes endophyticus]
MPKFAANLTMLFNEHDFLDRFQAAADAGFKGVEYLFPYAYDKQELADRLQQHSLTQVLHNLPAGNWDAGERGIAIFPERVGEFQDGVGRAIDYARALGCKQVNCLAGKRPENLSAEKAQQTLVDNLKFAAEKLHAAGIRLLIEPINNFDIPGFFIRRTDQAAQILSEVGSDNLFIQYDIYHAQREEGELANTIKKFLPQIAHIQLADNPGRNEPGTGEINYQWLFKYIDNTGFDGWIGCEYKPASVTKDGLGWIQALTA